MKGGLPRYPSLEAAHAARDAMYEAAVEEAEIAAIAEEYDLNPIADFLRARETPQLKAAVLLDLGNVTEAFEVLVDEIERLQKLVSNAALTKVTPKEG